MTPRNREIFDALTLRAKADDENAVGLVRAMAIKMCEAAPPAALVRVVEAFNNAFVDEQIAWAEAKSTIPAEAT